MYFVCFNFTLVLVSREAEGEVGVGIAMRLRLVVLRLRRLVSDDVTSHQLRVVVVQEVGERATVRPRNCEVANLKSPRRRVDTKVVRGDVCVCLRGRTGVVTLTL